MKGGAPTSNFIFGFLLILWSLMYNNPILAGIGAFLFIYSIFENKKFNIILYLVLIWAILATSLILSFIQFSSPFYQGNILLNCLLAIFLISWVFLNAYDITHDYKLSKIFQMKDQQLKNQSPFIKNVILLVGIIAAVFVSFLIVNYYL